MLNNKRSKKRIVKKRRNPARNPHKDPNEEAYNAINKDIKLTLKQERFCQAFVNNGGKPKEAAMEAGYSPKTAGMQGPQMLHNPAIQHRIDQLKKPVVAKALRKLNLTTEWVIRNLMKLSKEGRPDITRVKALELLGKHLQMFPEKVISEGSGLFQIEEQRRLLLEIVQPESVPKPEVIEHDPNLEIKHELIHTEPEVNHQDKHEDKLECKLECKLPNGFKELNAECNADYSIDSDNANLASPPSD